jgi:pyruvate kinase
LIYKKTKIICTIGPGVESVEKITGLIQSGMDAARLNFSHGDHEIHKRYIKNIRESSESCGKIIPIIQDLSGPKIRVGKIVNSEITLSEGQTITLTAEDITGNKDFLSLNHPEIIEDIKVGERVLMDDGNLMLKVVAKPNKHEVKCEVLTGGILKERKGVNLPDTELNVPSLTAKDIKDLDFGISNGLDLFAMSFVRSVDDIKMLKGILRAKGKSSPVISKIERPEAIANIDEIIKESDLVMVARGDLGVEISTEEVPLLQKMIIKKCNENLTPVITATQMLESMINSPTPTRAEASDVANAVLDGTDCVMLSAETSTGNYPIKAVEELKKIILRTETIKKSSFFKEIFVEDSPENTLYTLCNSASVISLRLSAKAIITISQQGKSPLLLSSHRPAAQIINATFSPDLIKQSKLIWGVESILFDRKPDCDLNNAFGQIREIIIRDGILNKGDRVVVLASIPFSEGGSANSIMINRI